MQQFTTLIDIFNYSLKNFPQDTEFYTKDSHKNFKSKTFKNVYDDAINAACGLASLGVKVNSKVGLIADNKVEWLIADMATVFNGAADVPRGTDSTNDEIQYILNHADCSFCFLEDYKLYLRLMPILQELSIEKFILLNSDKEKEHDNLLNLDELIQLGEKASQETKTELKNRMKNVTKDDLFTIIYTSGTTGQPKGVMLTHGNIAYNINIVPKMVGIESNDRCLSILPIWHIFERAISYALIPNGGKIYYTNIRDLKEDFLKCKPTFMASAPRLWENIYNGVLQKIQKESPAIQTMFKVAIELNKNYKKSLDYLNNNLLKIEQESDLDKILNTTVSAFSALNLALPSWLLDKLVFTNIKKALGGQLRGTISGGGALPAHVDSFFNTLGIPVYEGYGMTECAPIISARTTNHIVQGSVGFIPPGTQVKVLDEKGKEVPVTHKGTIFVKGPQVMKGYYKNEKATNNVLKDGWLNTGDLGFFSLNNTLSIRGRAKDTIVLLGGENLEPVPIESLLSENELVNQVMIVGQDQKNLGALIWPDFSTLKEKGFHFTENEDLNKNTTIRKVFNNMIKSVISTKAGFKSFEKISNFKFLPKPFEVGDELTNLFKMKRNIIAEKYDELIKQIYK